MNAKILVLLSTVALTVFGLACSSQVGAPADRSRTEAAANTEPEAIRVSLDKPVLRDVADQITLAGTVTPYEQVTLYARVDGYLKSIAVDIGDRVRKGQVLAEIDVPEMQASLEEKRARVARAGAAIKQAETAVGQYEADVVFQRLNHDRLQSIRKRDADVLPQQEVDKSLAEFDVARSKLEKAKADVQVADAAARVARAELETLQQMAQYAKLVAPMAGVVTERFVDPGDMIQAASSSRTQTAPIVSLAQLDRVRIVADVPEPQAPHVRPGTPATVEIAGLKTFRARCARISGALNAATRTMRAEIDVSNNDRTMRPGMTAKVTLDLRTIKNALTVPVTALRSQGGEYSVFLVQGETARRRPVKTGLESAEWIQVVEGLHPSDAIVVATASPLSDGARVIGLGAERRGQ